MNVWYFSKKLNVPQVVDEIEAAVYAILKPLGFRKHGRTLHRFVSEDLSQVISFQTGMPQDGMGGTMCVNLGIRIPECTERSFQPSAPRKKYYKKVNESCS